MTKAEATLPGGVLLRERPPAPPDSASLLSRRDLREAALQAMLFAGAALLPEAAWPWLCRRTSRARRRTHRARRFAAFAARVEAVLGPRADAEAVFDGWREELHRRRLSLFRELAGRGGGAEHRVLGAGHLQAALAAGRGAILWAAPFAHQSVNGKRALAEAGIRAVQVSVRDHGFLGSRFAAAVLNPPLLRTEERFLAGRLRFDPAAPGDLAARMRAVLRAGGVLLVENNAATGRRLLSVPFAPGFRLPMASGPLRLARAQGAPVLPCVTLARGPFGPYETHIAPPLFPGAEAGAAGLARVALAAREQMLDALRAAPAQFLGWPLLQPDAAAGPADPGGLSSGPETPEAAP